MIIAAFSIVRQLTHAPIHAPGLDPFFKYDPSYGFSSNKANALRRSQSLRRHAFIPCFISPKTELSTRYDFHFPLAETVDHHIKSWAKQCRRKSDWVIVLTKDMLASLGLHGNLLIQ